MELFEREVRRKVFGLVEWESGLRLGEGEWEKASQDPRREKWNMGHLGGGGSLGRARVGRPVPVLGLQLPPPPMRHPTFCLATHLLV